MSGVGITRQNQTTQHNRRKSANEKAKVFRVLNKANKANKVRIKKYKLYY
jgi:hypothetical protein